MTLYFFHLHECGLLTSDKEGREMPVAADLHAAAVREARAIMCAEVREGRLCLSCRIEVADEDGPVMFVPFRDAVAVSGV